ASLPAFFPSTDTLLTYQFRSATRYWCPPLAAFQQRRQLRSCQRNCARARHRPDKVAALQTLCQQAQAAAIAPENFDQPTTSAAEGKHSAIEGFSCQPLLHLHGETRHSAAHISCAAG